jgi:acyl dehydratase
MPTADVLTVRPATEADTEMLSRLARVGRRHPLGGRVLIAEIDRVPVAAMSVDEQRLTVDPARSSPFAVLALRTHATSLGPECRGIAA